MNKTLIMKIVGINLCVKILLVLGMLQLMAVPEAHGKEIKGRLLIINSYHEAASWSQNQIKTALLTTAPLGRVDVDVLHMNAVSITSDSVYQAIEDGIFQTMRQQKPDWLLLLGNLSFNLRDRIQQEWGDIPMLLLADVLHYAPRPYFYTDQTQLFGAEQIRPLSEPGQV